MKKIFFYLFGLFVLSQNAFCSVTLDPVLGFSGTIDLSSFYSAVAIVVLAVCTVISLQLALRSFSFNARSSSGIDFSMPSKDDPLYSHYEIDDDGLTKWDREKLEELKAS